MRSRVASVSPVTAIAFSPNGSFFASGNQDGSINIWSYLESGTDELRMIDTLATHDRPVVALAFDAMGTRLASASRELAQITDLTSGEESPALIVGPINSLEFSPGDDTLALGLEDGTVELWSIHDRRFGVKLGRQGESPLSISEAGLPVRPEDLRKRKMFAYLNSGKIARFDSVREAMVLVDPASGKILSESDSAPAVRWVTASDIDLFATSVRHSVTLRNDSGKLVRTLNSAPTLPGEIQFLQGTLILASGNEDSIFPSRFADSCLTHTKSWDARSGKMNRQSWLTVPSCLMITAADGRLIAYRSGPNTIEVVYASSGGHVRTLKIPKQAIVDYSEGAAEALGKRQTRVANSITALAFSPTSDRLALGTAQGTVEVRDTFSGERLGTAFHREGCSVRALTFSPDGMKLASGCLDDSIKLWDVSKGLQLGSVEPRRLANGLDVAEMIFSADGKLIASGGSEGVMTLWDVESGSEKRTIQGSGGRITALAFVLDDHAVVSGNEDGSLSTWDVDSGEMLRRFEGHTQRIVSVASSDSGDMLASSSWDYSIRFWDPETGQLLATSYSFEANGYLTYTPLGFYVAAQHGNNAFREVEGAFYRLDQYAVPFAKPDVVRRVLAGETVDPEIDWSIQHPPHLSWGKSSTTGPHVEIDVRYEGGVFLDSLILEVNGERSDYRPIQSSLSVTNTIRIEPRKGRNTVKVYAMDENNLKSQEIQRSFVYP